MMNPMSLSQPHMFHPSILVAVVALMTIMGGTIATSDAADRDTIASTLGVVRNEISANNTTNLISIDFDVPRHGPLCISINSNDNLQFVWEEYHNLYQHTDEATFRTCDFSSAVPLAPDGQPMPMGYRIEAAAAAAAGTNETRYFSCRKICASNGHKVKVCAGGLVGQSNECSSTVDCASERMIDMRTSRDYLPIDVQAGTNSNGCGDSASSSSLAPPVDGVTILVFSILVVTIVALFSGI